MPLLDEIEKTLTDSGFKGGSIGKFDPAKFYGLKNKCENPDAKYNCCSDRVEGNHQAFVCDK
jgi:hypothetical protein